jgi:hypothetical protein
VGVAGPQEQPRRQHLAGDAAAQSEPGLVAELEVLATEHSRPPGLGGGRGEAGVAARLAFGALSVTRVNGTASVQ